MASRYDFYFKQLVTEGELDAAFDQMEIADRNIVGDAGLIGVFSGLAVSQHSPTADLTVDVALGTAYDSAGQRCRVGTLQVVDMSKDYLGANTAVAGVGNSKILALFLYFDRVLSDPRIDGNSNTVQFSRAESFKFKVVQGAEATTGAEVAPALESDKVLLADVTIDFGQTQILTADINQTTRRQYAFKLSAGALSVLKGTAEESDQQLLTELNNHITDAGNAHNATAIDAAIAATWDDGSGIAGTTVDAVLEEIITDLAADAGADRVGSAAYTGSNVDFVAGSIQDALRAIADADWKQLEVGASGAYLLANSSQVTTGVAFNIAHEHGVTGPINVSLDASNDNIAPTGYDTSYLWRITPAAGGSTITGISARAGKFKILCNIDATENLILAHDTTSTATNRIYCPNNANLTIPPRGTVTVWYDGTTGRWRVISHAKA